MKIGFSRTYIGPGGALAWMRSFSNYCVSKGFEVSFGFDDTVDVFCSVTDLMNPDILEKIKNKNIKILQRLGAIYHPYDSNDAVYIKNRNDRLKAITNLADEVVYQSKFSKEFLFRGIYDGNEPDGDIIYNCPSTNLFTPIGDTFEKNSQKKIILAVAYWAPPYVATQSLDILANIIRHYENRTDLEFWVLGQAYPQNQRDFAAQNLNNIGKFDLLNAIPYEKMPALYRTADLILHLKVNEGCSNSIIEAMSTGTPIVGIHSGSLPEIVADSALLANSNHSLKSFPDVDLKDLINKIDLTLENSDKFSKLLIERSKQFVPELTFDIYIQKLVNLYNSSKK